MNIVDKQLYLLSLLESPLFYVYDNSLEEIKSFPAVVVDILGESRYNLAFGSIPQKCRFQIYVLDVVQNNERSVLKTRQKIALILGQISSLWDVNLEGDINYSAVKIDGKNAILADFVITY